MDTKKALDILIAVGICGLTSSETGLTCSDCPLYTDDDEEHPTHCKNWTEKEVGEAVKLLKTLKVLDPNPAIPGEWVLAKMLKEPERPEVIIPINHLTKEQLKNILESLNIDVELLEENDG